MRLSLFVPSDSVTLSCVYQVRWAQMQDAVDTGHSIYVWQPKQTNLPSVMRTFTLLVTWRSFLHLSRLIWVSLKICLFVCLFVRSFVRSFVCLFIRLFVCLFVHLFVRFFTLSFVRLFVHSFVCSFVLMRVHLCVCVRSL